MLVFIITIQFRTIGCFKYRNIHIVPFIETNKKFPSICIYKIKRLLWNISKCANSSREKDQSSKSYFIYFGYSENSTFMALSLGVVPGLLGGRGATLERGAPTLETFFKFSEKNYMKLKKICQCGGGGAPQDPPFVAMIILQADVVCVNDQKQC